MCLWSFVPWLNACLSLAAHFRILDFGFRIIQYCDFKTELVFEENGEALSTSVLSFTP